MSGDVLLGIAAIIAALAAAVTALANTRRLKRVHDTVNQIDGAVNGKPPGEVTLQRQVQDLHDQIPQQRPDIDDVGVLPLLREVALALQRLENDMSDLKDEPPP